MSDIVLNPKNSLSREVNVTYKVEQDEVIDKFMISFIGVCVRDILKKYPNSFNVLWLSIHYFFEIMGNSPYAFSKLSQIEEEKFGLFERILY